MQESRAQAMAFIAESIRRTADFTVDDVHLGIGLAMCDQVDRTRPRRATRTVHKLNKYLGSRRERSITAALPVLYLSRFEKRDVCVMVLNDEGAREDADLYSALLRDLDAPTTVKSAPGRHTLRASSGGHAQITIATPRNLAEGPSHRAVIVARLPFEMAKRVRRGLPGAADLPGL